MPSNIVAPLQWWDYNRDDPLARDLVGLWPFWEGMGGEVKDLVNGNHGMLTNMDPATDWVPSPYGWALDFNSGSSQYVAIDDFALDSFPVTINVWAKVPSPGTVQQLFTIADSASAFNYAALELRNSHISMVVRDGTWGNVEGTIVVTANKWFMATAVCESTSNVTVYLNGKNAISGSVPGAWPSSVNRSAIGVLYSPSIISYLTGNVAQVEVYAAALTPSEIQDLYDNPNALLEPLSRIPALPAVGVTARPSYVIGGGIAV